LSTGWQEKDGSAPETFARTKRTFKNPTDTIKNPAFPKKSRIFALGNTAQFDKKTQPGFLPQFKV